MKMTLALVLILGSFQSWAAVDVQGPNSSSLQPSVNGSWEYIRHLLQISSDPAPVIYFYYFDRATQPVLLTTLQDRMIEKFPEDLRNDPESIRRSFKALSGITYDADLFSPRSPLRGRVIQINPARSFDIESGGLRGYGLYLTAHEMLHYALNRKGIDKKYHHCLMVEENAAGESLMLKIARDLVGHGWANDIITFKTPYAKGYVEEAGHCGTDAFEIQKAEGAAGLEKFWNEVTQIRERIF